MRPYHPANLSLQPFPAWRIIALSWVAKALGVSFHVAGIPFGAEYNQKLWGIHPYRDRIYPGDLINPTKSGTNPREC